MNQIYKTEKCGIGFRVKVRCTQCRRLFWKSKSHWKRTKKVFCHRECWKQFKINVKKLLKKKDIYRVKRFGNRNRLYVLVKCLYCERKIWKSHTEYKKNKKRFCNAQCMGLWYSKNRRGRNHYNYGKKYSLAHRKNISNALQGIKRPNAPANINRIPIRIKNRNKVKGIDIREFHGISRKKWEKIRKWVLIRDNYTCKFCGKKPKKPEVHHFKPKVNILNKLITLCRQCHHKIHFDSYNFVIKKGLMNEYIKFVKKEVKNENSKN